MIPVDPHHDCRPVGEILHQIGGKWTVLIITRLGDGLIPRPDTVFQDGDQIHVVAAIDDLGRIEKVYDQPPPAH